MTLRYDISYHMDIVRRDDTEQARRCVDEAFIYSIKPGSRKDKEAAILLYRYKADMALLDEKWRRKRKGKR
jgi:hypothetical protein